MLQLAPESKPAPSKDKEINCDSSVYPRYLRVCLPFSEPTAMSKWESESQLSMSLPHSKLAPAAPRSFAILPSHRYKEICTICRFGVFPIRSTWSSAVLSHFSGKCFSRTPSSTELELGPKCLAGHGSRP